MCSHIVRILGGLPLNPLAKSSLPLCQGYVLESCKWNVNFWKDLKCWMYENSFMNKKQECQMFGHLKCVDPCLSLLCYNKVYTSCYA